MRLCQELPKPVALKDAYVHTDSAPDLGSMKVLSDDDWCGNDLNVQKSIKNLTTLRRKSMCTRNTIKP